MVDVMLALTILTVALLTLTQSLVSSASLNQVNRESALASDALRDTIERLAGVDDFTTLYNQCVNQPFFDVRGLEPVPGDLTVGQILLPTTSVAGVPKLFEYVVMPEFGLPMDLDCNGSSMDTDDKSGTYKLLPVLVRVRWQGASGERMQEVRTILADR